jgi:hypothetical protein
MEELAEQIEEFDNAEQFDLQELEVTVAYTQARARNVTIHRERIEPKALIELINPSWEKLTSLYRTYDFFPNQGVRDTHLELQDNPTGAIKLTLFEYEPRLRAIDVDKYAFLRATVSVSHFLFYARRWFNKHTFRKPYLRPNSRYDYYGEAPRRRIPFGELFAVFCNEAEDPDFEEFLLGTRANYEGKVSVRQDTPFPKVLPVSEFLFPFEVLLYAVSFLLANGSIGIYEGFYADHTEPIYLEQPFEVTYAHFRAREISYQPIIGIEEPWKTNFFIDLGDDDDWFVGWTLLTKAVRDILHEEGYTGPEKGFREDIADPKAFWEFAYGPDSRKDLRYYCPALLDTTKQSNKRKRT